MDASRSAVPVVRSKSTATTRAPPTVIRLGTAQPMTKSWGHGGDWEGDFREASAPPGGLAPRKILGATLGGGVVKPAGMTGVSGGTRSFEQKHWGGAGAGGEEDGVLALRVSAALQPLGAVHLGGASIRILIRTAHGEEEVAVRHFRKNDPAGIAMSGAGLGGVMFKELVEEKKRAAVLREMKRDAQVKDLRACHATMERASQAIARAQGRHETCQAARSLDEKELQEMRQRIKQRHSEKEKLVLEAKNRRVLLSHEARMRGARSPLPSQASSSLLPPPSPLLPADAELSSPQLMMPRTPGGGSPKKLSTSMDSFALAPEPVAWWGVGERRGVSRGGLGTVGKAQKPATSVDKWEFVGWEEQLLGTSGGKMPFEVSDGGDDGKRWQSLWGMSNVQAQGARALAESPSTSLGMREGGGDALHKRGKRGSLGGLLPGMGGRGGGGELRRQSLGNRADSGGGPPMVGSPGGSFFGGRGREERIKDADEVSPWGMEDEEYVGDSPG